MTDSLRIRFQTDVCGRCGGTGRHDYNQVDGDMCYGCRRAGRLLTKAGRTAREAYDALIEERCTKPVEEIKVGDKVFRKGEAPVFSIPPMFRRSAFYTVVASYRESGAVNWTLDFGPDKEGCERGVNFQPDSRVRVPNPEAVDQIMREVAAKYAGATLITGDGDEVEFETEQGERDAKKAAQLEARRAKAAEKRAAENAVRDAKRHADRDAWRQAHPDLAAYADGVDPNHEMDERRGPALWVAEYAGMLQHRALSPKETTRFREIIAQKAQEDAKKAASAHFGTVDQRETITATMGECKAIGKDGMGRTKYLVTMVEQTGATLKSFTTGGWPWEVEEGEVFTFTAIIDKHSEFRGQRETVISNVRLKRAK